MGSFLNCGRRESRFAVILVHPSAASPFNFPHQKLSSSTKAQEMIRVPSSGCKGDDASCYLHSSQVDRRTWLWIRSARGSLPREPWLICCCIHGRQVDRGGCQVEKSPGALKTSHSLVRTRPTGNYVELVKPAAPHGLTPIAAHPPWQSPIAVNIFNDRGAMGETRGRMHKVALPEVNGVESGSCCVQVSEQLRTDRSLTKPIWDSGLAAFGSCFSSVASPRLGAEITS